MTPSTTGRYDSYSMVYVYCSSRPYREHGWGAVDDDQVGLKRQKLDGLCIQAQFEGCGSILVNVTVVKVNISESYKRLE